MLSGKPSAPSAISLVALLALLLARACRQAAATKEKEFDGDAGMITEMVIFQPETNSFDIPAETVTIFS
jgi:hypothetical protein